jgi:hypothetical protein
VVGGCCACGGEGWVDGDVYVELAEEAEETVEDPDCYDGVEVGLVFAGEDFGVAVWFVLVREWEREREGEVQEEADKCYEGEDDVED